MEVLILFAQFGQIILIILQESIKTKHPQLLYESKLYRILQGGSKGIYVFFRPTSFMKFLFKK